MNLEETDAVEVALKGSTLDRLRVGLGALANLVRDPDNTRQIFVMAVVLDRDHIPQTLFRFLTEPGGLELMRDQPVIDSTTLDVEALAALPAGTLGHAYASHLLDNDLDADLFQAPPGVPPVVAYFGKRFRQTHDIWHVLTGYPTDVAGEIALQAFTFGQLGTPAPGLASITGALRWGLRDPLVARRAWDAYGRGKQAQFLLAIRWEELWAERLDALRDRFRIAPARA